MEIYHEHEQQQHQHRQHCLCWGLFSGCPPIDELPPCVGAAVLLLPPPPLPCDEPRSLQLDRCNSVTLHDIVCKADPILVQHFRWSRWTTLVLCSTKIGAVSRRTLTVDRMTKINKHKYDECTANTSRTTQTIFAILNFNYFFFRFQFVSIEFFMRFYRCACYLNVDKLNLIVWTQWTESSQSTSLF